MNQEIVDDYGSFIVKGPLFSVLECRGPVRHRQDLASQRRVICYAEQHLNSHPDGSINYAFVITGPAFPSATKTWSASYLGKVSDCFQVRDFGIRRGVPGQGCVRWVKWPTPTMLLEPLFLSHPEVAERMQLPEAREALGICLAESVIETFPAGGLVGLSVGHAFRGNNDPGALYPQQDPDEPGWDPDFDTEAEVCTSIVAYATDHLTRAQKNSR